jgi:hypothetical protein
MNQLPQRVFIGAERIDGVIAGQTQAAERTAALIVEREAIQERSLAVFTEKISGDRGGLVQTLRTNGHAGNSTKSFTANAAVVWE